MAECIFCKIVQGDLPADIVYKDQDVLAFNDINPQAPVHILIIPKKHYQSIMEENFSLEKLFHVIKHLARENGLAEKGFRVVCNCGDEGGQTVEHLHFHLLGGRKMEWPPG